MYWEEHLHHGNGKIGTAIDAQFRDRVGVRSAGVARRDILVRETTWLGMSTEVTYKLKDRTGRGTCNNIEEAQQALKTNGERNQITWSCELSRSHQWGYGLKQLMELKDSHLYPVNNPLYSQSISLDIRMAMVELCGSCQVLE